MILMAVALVAWPVAADGEATTPPINAANVEQLGRVLQIDFDAAPAEAGEIISGWLRVDRDGRRVVMVNRANDLLVWDIASGELVAAYSIPGTDGTNANMMDIAWDATGETIHSLHTDGAAYTVGVYTVADDNLQRVTVPAGDDRPVRVWAGDEPGVTWVEVLTSDPETPPYVLRLDVTSGEVLTKLDSVAEADRQSQVRIGRMPAPLAVTSSVEGVVQLWDLEAGDLLHAVELGAMPTFGHINGAAGRLLVWRDTQSEALHILDFETGANQQIAALDGAYVQALLLPPAADVVIGVNIDLEAVVVAWDVATGEQVQLGEYRECSRTPDMVQISEDGTTLVIGCDTGLDVWRIDS